jgi:hypothetical protein
MLNQLKGSSNPLPRRGWFRSGKLYQIISNKIRFKIACQLAPTVAMTIIPIKISIGQLDVWPNVVSSRSPAIL